MFNDVNEVRLMGNVTNDPDLRFTPSGTPVLSFGMATNRRYKKGEEWVDDTTFHNIVVWGNLGQNLSARIKKGTRMFVSGRIQVQSWEGNDGKRNYKTEIVADDVSLVSRYNEGTNAELQAGTATLGAAVPPKSSSPKEEVPQTSPEEDDSIDPDELPF